VQEQPQAHYIPTKIAKLTSINSWSRASIFEARVIDRLGEEPVAKLVRAREGNTGRVRTTSACNLNLEARNIRLWVANTSMQCNRFSADEVVAGSNRLGDGEGALSAVGVEDLCAP
jgi:hypothetical protein